MRLTIIMIFLASSLSGQISMRHIDRMRDVDRHLKTMLNMISEIDTINSDRVRLQYQVKSLLERIDESNKKEELHFEIIDELKKENTSLIDTVNYYKIETMRQSYQIQIEVLDSRNKELSSSNTKKDIIIGGLLTILGVVTGITVF